MEYVVDRIACRLINQTIGGVADWSDSDLQECVHDALMDPLSAHLINLTAEEVVNRVGGSIGTPAMPLNEFLERRHFSQSGRGRDEDDDDDEYRPAISLEAFLGGLEGGVPLGALERKGMSQEYFDSLERVNKKSIKPGATCPICSCEFLDDPYPLLVRLPCHRKHIFDLECASEWLREHNTCPICRTELDKPKKREVLPDSEEEDPDALFYA